MDSLGRSVAALILAALLITCAFSVRDVSGAADASLFITFAPPSLPADGGSYDAVMVQLLDASGLPMPAPDDIVVRLSSSRSEVGSVEPTVVVAKGSTYAVARFTSTYTPGETEITASASGFVADVKVMKTVEPSGSPKSLSVSLCPPQLLPEPKLGGFIVAQLLDARGRPAKAPADVAVTLSSSLTRVASVDPGLTIRAGATYGVARFYTTYSVGETTITASAPGYSSGSAVLKVIGPVPSRLALYAAPPVVAERSDSLIAVQLQDSTGAPAMAPADITVTLTSSNSTRAYLADSKLTIQAGKSYASTKLHTSFSGVVQVTASAEGFQPASADVRVVKPSLGSSGRLMVFAAPPVLPPSVDRHMILVVQLQDSVGQPLVASEGVTVYLASSDIGVGSTDATVYIPVGSSSAVASFYSTLLPGSTVVAASASDFESAYVDVGITGAVPFRLSLRSTPPTLPADGGVHNSIVVELQDVKGLPAKAPQDITVSLSSSNIDVGTVSEAVTIRKGMTYAVASFRSTFVAGATNITALSIGYAAANLVVNTAKLAPTQLAVYAAPDTLQASPGELGFIVVQLQDEAGLPAKAYMDTAVYLTSSSPTVGVVDQSVVVKAGSTYVKALFNSTGKPGSVKITAVASGLKHGSTTVKTVLYPASATFYVDGAPISDRLEAEAYSTLQIKIRLESRGKPVAGANVYWQATQPSIVSGDAYTDSAGYASATYRPVYSGDVSLSARVEKVGYTPIARNITISVKPLTFTVRVEAEEPQVEVGAPTTIKVSVKDKAGGVANASLSWSTTLGNLVKTRNQTDDEGYASATFYSNTPGVANITVSATKAGYKQSKHSILVSVNPIVTSTYEEQTPQTPSAIIPVIVAAAAAALLAAILIRRRGRPAVIEDEKVQTKGIKADMSSVSPHSP